MKLQQLLNEAWQKGHLTQSQMVRMVQHAIRNRGTVEMVDRKTSDGVEAIVTMSMFDFIDMFSGTENGMDRVKQLAGSKSTHSNDLSFGEKSKANDLLAKLWQSAIKNARRMVPKGWMLGGKDVGLPRVEDLSHNIVLKIKRDHSSPVVDDTATYLHYTLAQNIDSIQQHGLQPRDGNRVGYDGYRDRIFLDKHESTYNTDFIHQLLVTNKTPNPEVAVFKVSLPSDYKLYHDPQSNGVYGSSPIPPEYLQLIFRGKIGELDGKSTN